MNNNPPSFAIIMRGNRPLNPCLQILRTLVGLFEIVTRCHEYAPMPGTTLLSAPSRRFVCDSTPDARIDSSLGSSTGPAGQFQPRAEADWHSRGFEFFSLRRREATRPHTGRRLSIVPVAYGGKQQDYEHADKKALLRALAELLGTSERLIVEDALQRLYASLPPADQKKVSRALGGSPLASDTTRVECPAAVADAVHAFV